MMQTKSCLDTFWTIANFAGFGIKKCGWSHRLHYCRRKTAAYMNTNIPARERQQTGETREATDWTNSRDNRLDKLERQQTGETREATDWTNSRDSRLEKLERQQTRQTRETADWTNSRDNRLDKLERQQTGQTRIVHPFTWETAVRMEILSLHEANNSSPEEITHFVACWNL